MNRKISLIIAIIFSVIIKAEIFERVQIGKLYYNLDSSTKIAEVTYQAEYSANYAGMKSVTIPSSVKFQGVDYRVKKIGEGAFNNCDSLSSVTIPNSITIIGKGAFDACERLKSITLPNSITSIEEAAFDFCSMLNSIYLPNSITHIGKWAFMGCHNLMSIEIPNSVVNIGEDAFEMVPNIIYYGKVAGAPWKARSLNGYQEGNFIYNNKQKTILLACASSVAGEVNIPNTVTCIGRDAFHYCKNITAVSIPNSVTHIEINAFNGCSSLTSIYIPSSVTRVGSGAFYCKNLREIHYPVSLDLSEARVSKSVKTIAYIPNSSSQQLGTTIRMEKEGGVYKIPCEINGARMKMIFDSGAASVCLSETMAEYLLENGYITINDFIGVGSSSVADGRIVDHLRINLRDIEIEGMHLRNVEGVVIVGQKGSLLLGQSAIQALGPVTIDGDRLIIHNGTPQISESEIESIRSKAYLSIDSKDWYVAIAQFQKLDQLGVANYLDICALIISMQKLRQYDNSGPIIERWFETYAQYSSPKILCEMYECYACYYRFKTRPNYNEAIKYLLDKRNILGRVYKKNTTDYYYQDYLICKDLGDCYFYLEQFISANKYYGQAVNSYTSAKHIDMSDIDRKDFRDEKLGQLLYYIALCEEDVYYVGAWMKDAARLGNQDAQIYCRKAGLNYRR